MAADTAENIVRIQKRLAEPFSAKQVKWKPKVVKNGRALALAYINAHDVMNRLDAVLGIGGWQDEYTILNSGCVVCVLKCRIGDEWISREDVGEPGKVSAAKSAFSDALKRAAVKFGIGRYLYYLQSPWCSYDEQRKMFTETPSLPQWALPEEDRAKKAQQPSRPSSPSSPPKQNGKPADAKGPEGKQSEAKPVEPAQQDLSALYDQIDSLFIQMGVTPEVFQGRLLQLYGTRDVGKLTPTQLVELRTAMEMSVKQRGSAA